MPIRQLLKYLPAATFAGTIWNHIKTKYNIQETNQKFEELNKTMAQTDSLNNTIRTSLENLNKESLIQSNSINNINNNCNEIQNTVDGLQNNTVNPETISNLNTLVSKLNENYSQLLEIIKNSSSGSNTNFMADSNLIDSINNFVSNLTPLENLAVMHISASCIILFSLFSILSVFYGEFYIQKFNLETKFPRLAKFIQLRRKFQHYYILSEFILISLVLIGSTYVDLFYLPKLL